MWCVDTVLEMIDLVMDMALSITALSLIFILTSQRLDPTKLTPTAGSAHPSISSDPQP